MSDLYEKYALIDSKIEQLEAEKSAVKSEILSDMKSRGVDTEKHSLGNFVIAKLKKWTYPERIIKKEAKIKKEIALLEDEIKAEKVKSQSMEEATYEETDSLRFTSVKL